MLLDEECTEGHAEVFVGLIETQPLQIQLLLASVDLTRELVNRAAKRRGEMLAQCRHDTPQHVVMKNPEKQVSEYEFDFTVCHLKQHDTRGY